MAMQNLVSASLGAEAKATVRKDLDEIRKTLGFLTSLGSEDVRSIFKASKGYAPLLDKAYATAASHPEILPAVFPLEEFRKDYQLYKDLEPIALEIEELAESVQKTMMALSSDTMLETLDVYSAVKVNANKVPGLKVVADEMSVFFAKPKRKEAASRA